MILTGFDYAAPATPAEALELLTGTPGAVPLAGGQQLLVELQKDGRLAPLLVDLRKVAGLSGIDITQSGSLRIGAGTTLAEIAEDERVRAGLPALAAAALSCGDPQVRNRGTIGGNLSTEAAPTDLPVAAIALGADVVVAERGGGTRRLDAEAYAEQVAGGRPAGLLAIALDVPAPVAGSAAAFEKIAVRATRFPLCAVAVSAARDADGALTAVRVAVTGSVSRPRRLPVLEAGLTGTKPTLATVRARIRDLPQDTFVARPGVSREYLAHLTAVLTDRALRTTAAAATA